MASVAGDESPALHTFMKLALEQAEFALHNLEVPVGCVIVEDGNVIASGCNRTTETRNPSTVSRHLEWASPSSILRPKLAKALLSSLEIIATRHAEIEAIDLLLEQWQKSGLSQVEVAEKFSRCDLYVTCEPCIMCAAALSILGIRAVYYGCANDKFGGCGSILSLHASSPEQFPSKAFEQRGFKCIGGIMALEAVSLLRSFYDQGNPNAPKPHRPVPISH